MKRLLLLWMAAVLALAGCGGGVGSGGTGIDSGAPMSYSAGSVQGLGSIIVNGVRYETDTAALELRDASELKLGMTVEVLGSVSPSEPEGTASRVVSAAELRGVVESVSTGSASFTVLGLRVQSDSATALQGLASVEELQAGDAVQVYGLPSDGGVLRATRIEKLATAGENIASGTIESLDPAARRLRIGGLQVDYAGAALTTPLAPGRVVRVRGAPGGSPAFLNASSVEPWSLLLPAVQQVVVELSGVVGEFQGLGAFELSGVPVRADLAQITGGTAAAIGNGVTVAATGRMVAGVLVASRVAIQHVPGTGGPVAFSVSGPVAAYESPSSFMVRGQRVDAGSAEVLFSGGTPAELRNGRQVKVFGDRVIDGVLKATEVVFQPVSDQGNQPPDGGPTGGTGGGDGSGNPGNGNQGGSGNGNPGSGTGNCGGGSGVGNAGCGNGNAGGGNGNAGGGNGNAGGGNGNAGGNGNGNAGGNGNGNAGGGNPGAGSGNPGSGAGGSGNSGQGSGNAPR